MKKEILTVNTNIGQYFCSFISTSSLVEFESYTANKIATVCHPVHRTNAAVEKKCYENKPTGFPSHDAREQRHDDFATRREESGSGCRNLLLKFHGIGQTPGEENESRLLSRLTSRNETLAKIRSAASVSRLYLSDSIKNVIVRQPWPNIRLIADHSSIYYLQCRVKQKDMCVLSKQNQEW